MRTRVFLLVAVAALDPSAGRAQGIAEAPAASALRVVGAVRAPQPPLLDGRLDDPAWSIAPAVGGFTQARPEPGAPASEPTEVRVLFDEQALYLGVRLLDSRADSIVAPLARRDQNVHSDWFTVSLDTYRDRRTAFVFAVTPRGVKRDLRVYNDGEEDAGWDAVWEVATRVDVAGWTAEIRIPFSQLRFRAARGGDGSARLAAPEELVWGINFSRTLARRDELSHWSPTPPDAAGTVSRFGELRGLAGVAAPRRLELQPYSVARLTRAPGEPESPFYRANQLFGSAGLDLKYGLTPDLTLTATLNPDFGQVEADPAEVNLTAFESFFEEKRPFFGEGAEIFEAGWPQLFYSRRIGRAPRGSAPAQAVHSEAAEATTILGAAKLTGRLPGGWAVGALSAVTAAEDLRYTLAAGDEHRARVEPLTHYAVGRVSRDFRNGESVLGGLVTGAHRRLDAGPLRALLHGAAHSGGIDGRHRFGGGNYLLTGALIGSRIQGSDSAIARVQRAAGHYFQRPDAAHLAYDPARESLGGYGGRLALRKVGGGSWRWSVSLNALSPGFEINDLGYGFGADQIRQFGMVGYEQHRAGRVFRNWLLNAGQLSLWTFGGERHDAAVDVYGEAQLLNHWGGSAWYMRHVGGVTPTALRGGPALAYPGRHMGSLGLYSDRRRTLRFAAGSYWEVEDATGSRELQLHTTLTLRAGTVLSMSLRPSVGWRTNSWQYVGVRALAEQPHYLLARLEQVTPSLTARLDYSLSPTLSLQLYAQPFLSSGAYSEFRTVAEPRARRFEQRFHTFTPAQIRTDTAPDGSRRHHVDLTGDGVADASFADPSFSIRQLRSNAVLRWEYRPGSSLFVVWSQDRSGFDPAGHLDLGRDAGRLFADAGTQVLLVKLSFWLGT